MSDPLTADAATQRTTFSAYRKTLLTRISDTTFPPGTVYATPEGLRSEDEDTRAAFDVQGGVYPIRESVFQASYEPAALAAAPTPAIDPAREFARWFSAQPYHLRLAFAKEAFPTPAIDRERMIAALRSTRVGCSPASEYGAHDDCLDDHCADELLAALDASPAPRDPVDVVMDLIPKDGLPDRIGPHYRVVTVCGHCGEVWSRVASPAPREETTP